MAKTTNKIMAIFLCFAIILGISMAFPQTKASAATYTVTTEADLITLLDSSTGTAVAGDIITISGNITTGISFTCDLKAGVTMIIPAGSSISIDNASVLNIDGIIKNYGTLDIQATGSSLVGQIINYGGTFTSAMPYSGAKFTLDDGSTSPQVLDVYSWTNISTLDISDITPAKAGFTFSGWTHNSAAFAGTFSTAITVAIPLTAETITAKFTPNTIGITTSSLQDANVETSYSQALTSDISANAWSVTAGALPDGLTIDATTGIISGTPTKAGTFTFTVTAGNGGTNPNGTKQFTIDVKEKGAGTGGGSASINHVDLIKGVPASAIVKGNIVEINISNIPTNGAIEAKTDNANILDISTTNPRKGSVGEIKSIVASSKNKMAANVTISGASNTIYITAKEVGTANITVTWSDGGTHTFPITVGASANPFTEPAPSGGSFKYYSNSTGGSGTGTGSGGGTALAPVAPTPTPTTPTQPQTTPAPSGGTYNPSTGVGSRTAVLAIVSVATIGVWIAYNKKFA